MTIKQLKEIIAYLPDDTQVLISAKDVYTAETVIVEYHSDDRCHLIVSNVE